MSITSIIVNKQNENTICHTIESILPISSSVIIADSNPSIELKSICNSYGITIVKSGNLNVCQIKNNLIEGCKTKWVLFMNPWEIFVDGHEKIKDISNVDEKLSFRLKVINQNTITKEVRFWNLKNKLKFENPVFECVKDDNSRYIDATIYSLKNNTDFKTQLEEIEKWKLEKPTLPDPYYYQACIHLSMGEFDKFMNAGEYYLFSEKVGMSAVMTKYYMSMVDLYVNNKPQEAIKKIIPCIAVNPLMAEFWCILADSYFMTKKFEKAVYFYENAIILGSRRKNSDFWPMEVKKYKSYPEEMIEKCNKILKETRVFVKT